MRWLLIAILLMAKSYAFRTKSECKASKKITTIKENRNSDSFLEFY
jgi:hypothetical protein